MGISTRHTTRTFRRTLAAALVALAVIGTAAPAQAAIAPATAPHAVTVLASPEKGNILMSGYESQAC